MSIEYILQACLSKGFFDQNSNKYNSSGKLYFPKILENGSSWLLLLCPQQPAISLE